MNIWIWITIFAFIICAFLIIKGYRDAKKYPQQNNSSATYGGTMKISIDMLMPEGPPADEEMFMENDLIDEFSPEHIELESTLHRVQLRNKLHKIEEERQQDDVDLDYFREDGK